MSIDEMKEALEQHYEAAGFSDFNEKTLKGKSDEEVAELYKETFGEKAE